MKRMVKLLEHLYLDESRISTFNCWKFMKQWLEALSSLATRNGVVAFRQWIKFGMPQIQPLHIDCYLILKHQGQRKALSLKLCSHCSHRLVMAKPQKQNIRIWSLCLLQVSVETYVGLFTVDLFKAKACRLIKDCFDWGVMNNHS